MTTIKVVSDYWKLGAILLLALPLTAASDQVRILQSNAAGDRIHILDPATNKVVERSKVSRRSMGSPRPPTEAGSTSVVRLTTRSTWPTRRRWKWSRRSLSQAAPTTSLLVPTGGEFMWGLGRRSGTTRA